MHTHYASATHGSSVFLSVLLFGTLWRIGSLRALKWGVSHNKKHVVGLSKAALFQY